MSYISIGMFSILNAFVDPETHPTMHKISAVHGETMWVSYLKEMNKERNIIEGVNDTTSNTISLSNESITKLNSLQEWIESQPSVKVSNYTWVGGSFLSMSPARTFQSQLTEMNPNAPEIFSTKEEVDSFDKDFWRLLMTSFSVEELTELFEKGSSNGYPLRLQILVLPKDSTYKIHAHPNLELIIGMQGELMEYKLTDYHHSKKMLQRKSYTLTPPSDNVIKDMMDQFERCMVIEDQGNRSHFVDRVCTTQGKCCSNQIGSVHQSFSGKNKGTMVFVLWSGCHANVKLENIKGAKGIDRLKEV